jgi:hypothetical protein
MTVNRVDVVLVDYPFTTSGAKQNDRDNARMTNTIVAQISGNTARVNEARTSDPPLRELAATRKFQDGDPDGRRQAVPRCDELTECLLLPAHFRPATNRRVVTAFRANCYVNRAAGAIPAARSVPVPDWLGGAAFGPARQAGDRTLTTPFKLAQRASVGSTEASGGRLARVGLINRSVETAQKNAPRVPSNLCEGSPFRFETKPHA